MVRDLRNELNLECPRARGMYLEEVPESVWGNRHWVLEPKLDGDRMTMQLCGFQGTVLVGRNRKDKLKGVAKAGPFMSMQDSNPPMARMACPPEYTGTILDGEQTEFFTKAGKWTKSTWRRYKNGEFVGYTAWTVLMYRGEDVRHLPDWKRRQLTEEVVAALNAMPGTLPKIRVIDREPATLENLNKLFAKGLEGGIVKDKRGSIPTDVRVCPTWYKAKGAEFRTVDAFVTGVTEGKSGGSGVRGEKPQPDGRAATFEMSMLDDQGREVRVCKMGNLPENAKLMGVSHFPLFEGNVCEMQVSGWDGERFRWARFAKWREDKGQGDCLLSEQIGG